MKLDTLLEEVGSNSLSDYQRNHKKQGLPTAEDADALEAVLGSRRKPEVRFQPRS